MFLRFYFCQVRIFHSSEENIPIASSGSHESDSHICAIISLFQETLLSEVANNPHKWIALGFLLKPILKINVNSTVLCSKCSVFWALEVVWESKKWMICDLKNILWHSKTYSNISMGALKVTWWRKGKLSLPGEDRLRNTA